MSTMLNCMKHATDIYLAVVGQQCTALGVSLTCTPYPTLNTSSQSVLRRIIALQTVGITWGKLQIVEIATGSPACAAHTDAALYPPYLLTPSLLTPAPTTASTLLECGHKSRRTRALVQL